MQSSSEEEAINGSRQDDVSSDEQPTIREAGEVFIFMHRYFRASRNIRAHWFLDHLNKTVQVPCSGAQANAEDRQGKYSKEMEIIGLLPKDGDEDEIVEGQRFLVTMDTKVTYLSRFYRHVFVLDLSPSAIVADDQAGGCLHTKLLESLRLSMHAVTKSFKIPGTNHAFCPQIHVSVCVFTPFLGFDEDLVLAQGVLLTETNVETLLETVTERFNKLLFALHKYAQPLLKRWGNQRRLRRRKYDSTGESKVPVLLDSEGRPTPKFAAYIMRGPPKPEPPNRGLPKQDRTPFFKDDLKLEGVMGYKRGVWPTPIVDDEFDEFEDESCEKIFEGYIHPEWALIFMLRMGLMAVQMLPENTQSNIVILTDAVCGMPDAVALHQLLSQLRSYTVSCSFIQIHGRARSEPCFGHVSSSELFHFLAMATFGSFIPNCKCSIGEVESVLPSNNTTPRHTPSSQVNSKEDVHDQRNPSGGSVGRRPEDEVPPGPCAGEQPGRMNAFHRALVCWCFQNALQDNVHIQNLVNEINPEFASMYTLDTIRQKCLELNYFTTVHELLYVRLREGYTLKNTKLEENDSIIRVHLTLPFRPLVFIDYIIYGTWPLQKNKREHIRVEVAIVAPYNVMKDLLSEDGDFVNMTRQKGIKVFRNTLDSLIEADRLLIHLHSFNVSHAYYTIPFGVSTQHSLFRLNDHDKQIAMEMPNPDIHTMTFVDFWRVLCNLDESIWQKWVHTHSERILLRVDGNEGIPLDIFEEGTDYKVDCSRSLQALHLLLRDISSFCLLHQLAYVKFVYGSENEKVPKYFYMIRVCLEPPCVTLKLAFLGGISSSDRRSIADEFRRNLISLKLPNANGEPSDLEAVTVIRRPVERILVRYRSVPSNMRTIVRLRGDSYAEDIRHLTLHNAISKYLSCRRRIWNLPCVFDAKDLKLTGSSKEHATLLLTTLLHRRLREGFSIAWSDNGIVGVCRQVVSYYGFALEQYVFFPPQSLQMPFRVNRNRLPSTSRVADMDNEKEDDYGMIVFESDKEKQEAEEVEEEEEVTHQVVVEYWSEPLGGIDKETSGVPPNPCHDDDLVCVLFTLDQLLRWCAEGIRGALTVRLTSPRTSESHDPAQPLSGCVSVLVQPFSLPALLHHSEKRLLVLPLFANDVTEQPNGSRLKFLLEATLKELENYSDCYIEVDDPLLWMEVMGNVHSISSPEKKGLVDGERTRTRMYLHRINPWTMVVIMIPREINELKKQRGIPILFCLCDEPSLAYRLANDAKVPDMIVEDLRLREDQWTNRAPGREKAWTPPDKFIWATRCSDLQKGLYRPTSLASYVDSVREVVYGRAVVSALYECISKNIPVAASTVQEVIEEYCEYMNIEIPAASDALRKFCTHVRDSATISNCPADCCDGTDFESLFSNVVEQCFKAIPALPNYFVYDRKSRPKERRQTERSPLPFEGPVFAAGEKSPEESEISSVNNLTRGGSAPPSHRMRGLDRPVADYPIFIYFCCAVRFPDQSMETFPIEHLPYCVKYIVDKCKSKPNDCKLSDVRVTIDLYVFSWAVDDDDDHTLLDRLSLQSNEGRSYANQRARAFRNSLPYQEYKVIERLIMSLNRLIEMEVVLTESRQETVTLNKLTKISKFISKELKASVADGRIDQRERALQLVINSQEAVKKLKERLDGIEVEYCVLRRIDDSDMFYCCPIDDRSTFEMRTRHESRRSSATHIPGLAKLRSQPSLESNESGTSTSMQASPIRERSCCSLPFDAQQSPVVATGTAIEPLKEKEEPFADFWLILTVTDKLVFQLCRRRTDCHDLLFNLMWRRVKQSVRVINQEMLLEKAFTTRECDPLLLSPKEEPRFVGTNRMSMQISDDEDEDSGSHGQITDDARVNYEPGYFACDMKSYHWFTIHPRIRPTRRYASGAPLISTGFDVLKSELASFRVRNKNMQSVYVLKEPDGNVIYMQLHHSVDTVKEVVRNAPRGWRKEVTAKLNKDKQQTNVLLTVHGVREPGKEFSKMFMEKLQKRLDNTALDNLVEFFSKNIQGRLENSDVNFIQRCPSSPSTLFYLTVPSSMGGFMQAVSFYIQQQMSANEMHLAKCIVKDESGSARFRRSGASPASTTPVPSGPAFFLPYPAPEGSTLPKGYTPSFYLRVMRSHSGNRSTGIACIEIRFVNAKRELIELKEGRMNKNTHSSLVCASMPIAERLQKYATMTRAEEVVELTENNGVCAYAEIIVWQAGDVGIEQLKGRIKGSIQQAYCDVITEFGLLNCTLLEVEPLPPPPPSALPPLPMSPNMMHTPPMKSSSSTSSTTTTRSSHLIRQRSSTEAMTPLTGPTPLLTPSSAHKHSLPPIQQQQQSSHFSFDMKRSSIASNMDKMDQPPETPSVAVAEPIRPSELVCDDFMECAFDWLSHVNTLGCSHSLQKREIYLDSIEAARRACGVVAHRLMEALNFSEFEDRVVVAHRREDGKYETCRRGIPEYKPLMQDRGVDMSDGCPREDPEFVLMSYVPEVAEETRRYGFGPEGDPPEKLVALSKTGGKELYVPNLSPFVPRQRILYAEVRNDRITVFLYNFLPELVRNVLVPLESIIYWYNARCRVFREVGLHKLGITHLTPLPKKTDIGDHQFNSILWTDTEKLCTEEQDGRDRVTIVNRRVVPEKMKEILRVNYAHQLHKIFRLSTPSYLSRSLYVCRFLDQINQLIHLRLEVMAGLEEQTLFKQLHENLMKGRGDVMELHLLALHQSSRPIHFVDTPVLFFPAWRKSVGEIRDPVERSLPDPLPEQDYDEQPPVVMIGAVPRYPSIGTTLLDGPGGPAFPAESPIKFSPLSRADADAATHMEHKKSGSWLSSMRDRKLSANPTLETSSSTPSTTPTVMHRLRSHTLSVNSTPTAVPPPNSLPPSQSVPSRRDVTGTSMEELPPLAYTTELAEGWHIQVLYILISEFMDYLEKLHGLKPFTVHELSNVSTIKRSHQLKYDKDICYSTPEMWMYKAVPGGIVLVQLTFAMPYFEMRVRAWSAFNKGFHTKGPLTHHDHAVIIHLEETVEKIVTGTHIHSFTYDFHLRMLANYLCGNNTELFRSGYNTNAFLADFLQYYGCRPPHAHNCVYEERIHFDLQHSVQNVDVWQHFLDSGDMYKWRVLRLKDMAMHSDMFDFMLVSLCPTPVNGQGITVRVVLYDGKRASGSARTNRLHLLFYLIQILPEGTIEEPLPVAPTKEDDRHREESRASEGEFRQVDKEGGVETQKVEPPPEKTKEELDEMIRQVGEDVLPTVDGRRRFSSGTQLKATQPLAMADTKQSNETDSYIAPVEPFVVVVPIGPPVDRESNNEGGEGGEIDDEQKIQIQEVAPRRHRKGGELDEEGEAIPGEQATYVHYLSSKQRTMQKRVEDAVSQYTLTLRRAVTDAEGMCRIDTLWKQIVCLPLRTGSQQTDAILQLLRTTANRNLEDPWKPMLYAQHEGATPADLDTITSLVTKERMDIREPLILEILHMANHARFCRFLLARYGPKQCRYFEYPHSYKKAIVITNPNYIDSMFLVSFNDLGQMPVLEVLYKEREALDSRSSFSPTARYVDKAFDELIQVCLAFIWSELGQKG